MKRIIATVSALSLALATTGAHAFDNTNIIQWGSSQVTNVPTAVGTAGTGLTPTVNAYIVGGAGAGGTASTDNSGFSAGTSNMTPAGCEFTTGGATAITTAHMGTVGCTSARAFLTDKSSVGGTSLGAVVSNLGTLATGTPNVENVNAYIVGGGGSGGTSGADAAAFTAGATLQTPSGCEYTSGGATPLSSGHMGLIGCTPTRAQLTDTSSVGGTALTAAVSAYGTAPTGTAVEGMNAYITNTPPVSQSGTWTVQPGNTPNTSAWLVTGTGGTFPITAASLPLPSGASTGLADNGAWTAGATVQTQAGCEFTTGGATALATGHAGVVGCTAARDMFSDMEAWAGTAITNVPTAVGTAGTGNTPTINAYIVGGGGSGGTSGADAAAWTAGATLQTPVGCEFTSGGATVLVTAHMGTIGCTAARAQLTDKSSVDGTALGAVVSNLGTLATGTPAAENVNAYIVGGAAGVSAIDEATATPGTSLFAGGGGFFQTTATNNALTNLQQGMFQLTANRALFTNLRSATGVEEGTTGSPLYVNTQLAFSDNAAWTVGSSPQLAVGCEFTTGGATAITSAHQAMIGCTSARAVLTDKSSVAGTALSAAVSAYGTAPTGTEVEGVNAFVTNTNANGQAVMASSAPVVIASNQSNLPTNLAQVGGSSVALGSTTASASIPVVIASNQTAADPCMFQAKTNTAFSSASGTFAIGPAGVSAKKIYVCSIILWAPSAVSVSLAEGSSSTCGTSNQAAVIGVATNGTAANGMAVPANGAFTLGNGGGTVAATATAADYLCVFQSGTAQLAGNVTTVQQ